jgi:hypothetical protein
VIARYVRARDLRQTSQRVSTVPVTGGAPEDTGVTLPFTLQWDVALRPDGQAIAYATSGTLVNARLWVVERSLPGSFSRAR